MQRLDRALQKYKSLNGTHCKLIQNLINHLDMSRLVLWYSFRRCAVLGINILKLRKILNFYLLHLYDITLLMYYLVQHWKTRIESSGYLENRQTIFKELFYFWNSCHVLHQFWISSANSLKHLQNSLMSLISFIICACFRSFTNNFDLHVGFNTLFFRQMNTQKLQQSDQN